MRLDVKIDLKKREKRSNSNTMNPTTKHISSLRPPPTEALFSVELESKKRSD
jgi:hypothetical protein